VVIVEDVCNNFSTTDKMISLVESSGGVVVAIAVIFNRSALDNYQTKSGQRMPVLSVVHKHLPQYKQEDPEVARDIAAANVVWKPKDNWETLAAAM